MRREFDSGTGMPSYPASSATRALRFWLNSWHTIVCGIVKLPLKKSICWIATDRIIILFCVISSIYATNDVHRKRSHRVGTITERGSSTARISWEIQAAPEIEVQRIDQPIATAAGLPCD